MTTLPAPCQYLLHGFGSINAQMRFLQKLAKQMETIYLLMIGTNTGPCGFGHTQQTGWLGGFALIIYMDHLYIWAMVVVTQIFMGRELFCLLRETHEDSHLPGFRLLNWHFFYSNVICTWSHSQWTAGQYNFLWFMADQNTKPCCSLSLLVSW